MRSLWHILGLAGGLVGFACAIAAPAAAGDPPAEPIVKRSAADSTPAWPRIPTAPDGAPNIVVILLDDIGFADTSVFGGIARTPALEKLAAKGLRYNNFNVTAMCSPTRAALLTGRNHHEVGFGIITEGANGYHGYSSYWNESTASVAEVLRRNGYRTAAVGKWHNTPEWEITRAGPFDRWPTGLGFDHFYGFLGAEDNHWEPNRLYRDTTPVQARVDADDTYHLTTDLADRAIEWLAEHRSFAPDKPFFLYFSTGAVHTPHHAPADWIARYRGKFDEGWDALRSEIFERQKRLGVVPHEAVLTERPPQIPAWDSLSDDERRLFARQMEVYAAFVAHTDYQIGRVLEAIHADPVASDNTLIFYIAGDNGAAGRRLPNYGGIATLAEELTLIDQLGGPEMAFNQYQGGWGWMGNTPFKYWKTVASHFGGLRAPMIISWPARIRQPGGLREQFQHVTDIVPTIYDAIGLSPPAAIAGVKQVGFDGTSLLATLTDPNAGSAHETQYFELSGSRAIYHKGWIASALSAYMSPSKDMENWELYNLSNDFTQANDLADRYPQKLAEMKRLFDREARANHVYPLMGASWGPAGKPFWSNDRKRFDFYQGSARIPWAQLPNFNQSHALEAEVVLPAEGTSGALATFGYRQKGFSWYVQDGRLIYEHRTGLTGQVISAELPRKSGPNLLRYEFICETCTGPGRSLVPISGTGRLLVDGALIAEGPIEHAQFINGGEAFGFYLGEAAGSRVSDAFDMPFTFTGDLKRFSIILDGQ